MRHSHHDAIVEFLTLHAILPKMIWWRRKSMRAWFICAQFSIDEFQDEAKCSDQIVCLMIRIWHLINWRHHCYSIGQLSTRVWHIVILHAFSIHSLTSKQTFSYFELKMLYAYVPFTSWTLAQILIGFFSGRCFICGQNVYRPHLDLSIRFLKQIFAYVKYSKHILLIENVQFN